MECYWDEWTHESGLQSCVGAKHQQKKRDSFLLLILLLVEKAGCCNKHKMPFFLFLSFECFSLLISCCSRHTYIQHRGLLAGHHPNTILAHRCITQVLWFCYHLQYWVFENVQIQRTPKFCIWKVFENIFKMPVLGIWEKYQRTSQFPQRTGEEPVVQGRLFDWFFNFWRTASQGSIYPTLTHQSFPQKKREPHHTGHHSFQ